MTRAVKRISALSAVVVLLLASGCAALTGKQVAQPFWFNHKIHMKHIRHCIDCHVFAQVLPVAGIPSRSICTQCHSTPQGKSLAEKEVIQWFKKHPGEQIQWVIVDRLPGDVYFSHRMHVTLAKMKCSTCHGDVKSKTAPFTHIRIPFTMTQCLACHEKMGARLDCTTCHQ
jgi:hypothetical protein